MTEVANKAPVVVVEEQLCGADVIGVALAALGQPTAARDGLAGVCLEAVLGWCRAVGIFELERDFIGNLTRLELARLLGRPYHVASGPRVTHASEPVGRCEGSVDRHPSRQPLDLAVQSVLRESPSHRDRAVAASLRF